MKLHTAIFVGLTAGVAVGAVARLSGAADVREIVVAIQPFGLVFIRLITMVVVPLVIASLFVGVASLGDLGKLGRLGGQTLAYFVGTTAVAALLGLVVALAARLGDGVDAATQSALVNQAPAVGGAAAATASGLSLVQTLISMVPQNPFASAAQADLLPLIVAVCLFGAAATAVSARTGAVRWSRSSKASAMRSIDGRDPVADVTRAAGGVRAHPAGTVATSGADLLDEPSWVRRGGRRPRQCYCTLA